MLVFKRAWDIHAEHKCKVPSVSRSSVHLQIRYKFSSAARLKVSPLFFALKEFVHHASASEALMSRIDFAADPSSQLQNPASFLMDHNYRFADSP